MRFLMITLIFMLIATQLFGANEQPCSPEEARTADAESASLNDWDSLYKSFKQYGHCDDAGIAEGYSESIARLLTEGWAHVYRFNELSLQDKTFERFVFKHIDELMTPEQEKVIYENIRLLCPDKFKKLCKLIEARLDETKPSRE